MSDPLSPYCYRLFGLTIHSAIMLPELAPLDPGSGRKADIVIDCGPIEIPAGAPPPVRGLYWMGDGGVLLVKRVGRYGISGGSRITVDAEPDALGRNVRLFLLGSAIGALLIQRGILPLHANAIDFNGRAIGFLGRSGAGKSTLAAAFHDLGWRVLSDDVCAVTETNGGFVAQPGIPRLRLWRDAIERSGRSTEGHERAFDDVDKYTVGIAADASEAVPLAALYLLAVSEADDFAVRRLSGSRAVGALMGNTYRGAYMGVAGDSRRHFETCLALSRRVPVFELARPWDGARVGDTVAFVEAHLASRA